MSVDDKIKLLEEFLSGMSLYLKLGHGRREEAYLEKVIIALDDALEAYKEKWED